MQKKLKQIKFSQPDLQKPVYDFKTGKQQFFISQQQEQKYKNKQAKGEMVCTDGSAVKILKEGPLRLITKDSKGFQSKPEIVYVKLNKNAIYWFPNKKASSNMREISGSVELQKIISSDDNSATRNCCRRVTEIEEDHNLEDHEPANCFQFSTNKMAWKICGQPVKLNVNDFDRIQEWRDLIIGSVIVHDIWKNGGSDTNTDNVAILDDGRCAVNKKWNWNEQDAWPCQCNVGEYQSPIIINDGLTIQNEKPRMRWGYKPCRNCRNFYDGHEQILLGDFGQIEFSKQPDKLHIFDAYKVTFKFPAEHQMIIDNEQFKDVHGEMLIHHKDDQDKKLIISIFLQEDQDCELTKFFEDINIDMWNFTQENVCLADDAPNLDEILFIDLTDEMKKREKKYKQNPKFNDMFDQPRDNGADATFNKSFFWYEGSDTTPPCDENVDRVVMMNYIPVPKIQLKALKDKTYDDTVQISGNGRKFQPLNGRQVFKYIDEHECYDPLMCPYAKKKEDIEMDEIDKAENVGEDYEPEFNFLKTTQQIINFQRQPFPLLTGQLDDKTKVEFVKPDELPEGFEKRVNNMTDMFLDELDVENLLQKDFEDLSIDYE